ncbi:unnamed protein product [Camellia sinensis]
MEFTRVGFRGPDAKSRPSKQVFLLVRAALRKVLASASFWVLAELTLDTDFCRQDTVIWWRSLQSWTAPLCFSMLLEGPSWENRLDSFPASDKAV